MLQNIQISDSFIRNNVTDENFQQAAKLSGIGNCSEQNGLLVFRITSLWIKLETHDTFVCYDRNFSELEYVLEKFDKWNGIENVIHQYTGGYLCTVCWRTMEIFWIDANI